MSERFQYHFEPKKGWMNDPNGLCFFQGKYHAFFQYNPYEPVWGPMHWGHAVSEDLIHWEEERIALTPEEEYENDGGCFSGSAIVKDDTLYLFYTSVSKKWKQTQSVAYSTDGIHFKKYESNPVIAESPLGDNTDFRDPKVFVYKDSYYMVCGAGIDGIAKMLLFRSEDLWNWSYVNCIYESEKYGQAFECPDLFPLGDKYVLMFSAMKPEKYATVFLVGDFDGREFWVEETQYVEGGKDFYAPQTFVDNKGRRILIGWFYHWGKELAEGVDYAGALSIPRELSMKNGRIYNFPVEEAKHLLSTKNKYVMVEENRLLITGKQGKVIEHDFSSIPQIDSIEDVYILWDKKAVEIFINQGAFSCAQWLV